MSTTIPRQGRPNEPTTSFRSPSSLDTDSIRLSDLVQVPRLALHIGSEHASCFHALDSYRESLRKPASPAGTSLCLSCARTGLARGRCGCLVLDGFLPHSGGAPTKLPSPLPSASIVCAGASCVWVICVPPSQGRPPIVAVFLAPYTWRNPGTTSLGPAFPS